MVRLSVGVSDVGWINISQYDEETSEWKEIMKNYNPWDFQEQFLADVADWYGEEAVPEYKAALEEATAHNGGWADDDPEGPPPSARRGKNGDGGRRYWDVYRREVRYGRRDQWQWQGETMAVSAKQAVNNVCWRIYGRGATPYYELFDGTRVREEWDAYPI